MAPEEVRAPIARKIPRRNGSISTLVFRPSLAPLMKVSYMGTFFHMPHTRMMVMSSGRNAMDNKLRISGIR